MCTSNVVATMYSHCMHSHFVLVARDVQVVCTLMITGIIILFVAALQSPPDVCAHDRFLNSERSFARSYDCSLTSFLLTFEMIDMLSPTSSPGPYRRDQHITRRRSERFTVVYYILALRVIPGFQLYYRKKPILAS